MTQILSFAGTGIGFGDAESGASVASEAVSESAGVGIGEGLAVGRGADFDGAFVVGALVLGAFAFDFGVATMGFGVAAAGFRVVEAGIGVLVVLLPAEAETPDSGTQLTGNTQTHTQTHTELSHTACDHHSLPRQLQVP